MEADENRMFDGLPLEQCDPPVVVAKASSRLSSTGDTTKREKAVRLQNLSPIQTDRIIEMAWEDRTPFEAIQMQFGLSEAEVIKLMRRELKLNSFKLWRKRVNSGKSSKHLHKRSDEITRFKSSNQRSISNNKPSK
jgi:uncharacterized protein (TIGR03643 family)